MIVRRTASLWQASDGRAASVHHTQHGGGGSRPHTPRSLTSVPPASEDAWSSESDGGISTDNIQVRLMIRSVLSAACYVLTTVSLALPSASIEQSLLAPLRKQGVCVT